MSAQTETKSGNPMRIKEIRQGLHTLLQTQDLEGLMLFIYAPRNTGACPAIVPVMCRGWMANSGNRLAAARTRLP